VHNNETGVKKNSRMVSSTEKTEFNYVHASMIFLPPIIATYGFLTTKLVMPTFILAAIMYFWTGLGITAGYHRLWSHRAYSASWIVQVMLCLGGAGAFEGSAKWWCRNHRAHHRYTDTDKDPYNAKKGFYYAHIGWMLEKQKVNKIGFANISDLNKDPLILWQHKYYPYISIGIGLVLPTVIASFWGDAWGGYFYAGLWKMIFVHHATFFVNSLAHTFGDKTFSDHHTAFDSVLTAVLTLGEGYHNYHHEFPQDYRNGIKPYHYDPTKWLIKLLNVFNLTYDLKCITDDEIGKARLQMNQRHLDTALAKVKYGKNFSEGLPEMSWEDIKKKMMKGEQLIVIDGMVHDVKNFVHEHPGGRQTLLNFIGTDSSNLFRGDDGAHVHSKEAVKFLWAMRVGRLKRTDIGA